MAHGSGQNYLVDLEPFANNRGVSYRSNTSEGRFNVWGNSYPAEELPGSRSVVTFGRKPFRFPSKGERSMNNVVCIGQTILFEEGTFCGMAILGAAERRSSDLGSFIGSDGRAVDVPIRLSDWWPGARGYFGNHLALRCSSLHYPRHVQTNMGPALWMQEAAFPPTTTGKLKLPDHPALHIFSLTLRKAGVGG